MTELLTWVIVLACPLGMASMMALPFLGRLFRRRGENAVASGEAAT